MGYIKFGLTKSTGAQASWMDSQSDEVLSKHADPKSECQKELSKIKLNAGRALEEFANRS